MWPLLLPFVEMPKVPSGIRKKRCHHCAVEVSSSNWSKHCKSARHIAKESASIRRSADDSDDDFELAKPTEIPRPGPSTEETESEVLNILKAKDLIPSLRTKKTRNGTTGTAKPDKGNKEVKRDKASLKFSDYSPF